MGFCESAKNQFNPSSSSGNANGNANGDKSSSSFVTEPPLGPRPDLLEPVEETDEEFEEYDEARCQVHVPKYKLEIIYTYFTFKNILISKQTSLFSFHGSKFSKGLSSLCSLIKCT